MKLVKLSDLFTIKNGNGLELLNLEECERYSNSINYVSRTEKNNGISAFVRKIIDVSPFPANVLTVAVGGSVLSTFYQPQPFYTGFHIQVLFPKIQYAAEELQFYAYCIRKNKYRYNYGRQANKTLKDILIPDQIPDDWQDIKFQKLNTLIKEPLNNQEMHLTSVQWNDYKLTELFDISASKDELISELTIGKKTPYITSSNNNNGVTDYVEEEPTNSAKTITANRGGSVGYFFYQPFPYKVTPVDVRILTPKFNINTYIGIFMKTILQLEKYRYNYSRKMGSARLTQFKIKLPSKNKNPDWGFMENYIKSLPYSKSL